MPVASVLLVGWLGPEVLLSLLPNQPGIIASKVADSIESAASLAKKRGSGSGCGVALRCRPFQFTPAALQFAVAVQG